MKQTMKGIRVLKGAVRPALGIGVLMAAVVVLAPALLHEPKARAQGNLCDLTIMRCQNQIRALNLAIAAAESDEARALLVEELNAATTDCSVKITVVCQ